MPGSGDVGGVVRGLTVRWGKGAKSGGPRGDGVGWSGSACRDGSRSCDAR